jgi:ferric-dicitrate binding protein FerR (iron transport regulator)
MTDRQQDTDLRARFDAQRSADASEAPSFAAMMARARAEADAAPAIAPHRFNARRLVYIGSLAAAAAIAALIVIPRSSSNEDAFEDAVHAYQTGPALGSWRSPTDGLLNVPGSRLMSTVPSVGTQ